MNKLESKVQSDIIKFLKTVGHPIRLISASSNGEPDIIACIHGRFVGIEVKQVGQKPTELQLAKHRRIREAGGIVIVAESVEDVRGGLKKCT